MKIISDAEYFGWKFTAICLSVILLIIMLKSQGKKNEQIQMPKIVHDTITVQDTVEVRDTIYRWKEITVQPSEIEDSLIKII